jgi:hypothetical protein
MEFGSFTNMCGSQEGMWYWNPNLNKMNSEISFVQNEMNT